MAIILLSDYDAASTTLKDLLDKRDALHQKNCWMRLLKGDEVMKKSYSIYRVDLEMSEYVSMEHYFVAKYGDIVVLLYHEDMWNVRDLLFKNSRKEKTLKRFLKYCYMIDVKVVLEGLNGA